jgi:hypothetical protein
MTCLFKHQWKRYVAYKVDMRRSGKGDDIGYYRIPEHNGPNNEYRICQACSKIEHDPQTTVFWGATYKPSQPYNEAVAVYSNTYPDLVFLPVSNGSLFPDNTSSDPEQTRRWRERVSQRARGQRQNMELMNASLSVSMLEKGHHPFLKPNAENLAAARERYQALVEKYQNPEKENPNP